MIHNIKCKKKTHHKPSQRKPNAKLKLYIMQSRIKLTKGEASQSKCLINIHNAAPCISA